MNYKKYVKVTNGEWESAIFVRRNECAQMIFISELNSEQYILETALWDKHLINLFEGLILNENEKPYLKKKFLLEVAKLRSLFVEVTGERYDFFDCIDVFSRVVVNRLIVDVTKFDVLLDELRKHVIKYLFVHYLV